MGAANETQFQTVDQNMADVQTDHDMADVAVVEHPHPHEDEEHMEWEHPDKGYFDEDDGTALDPVQVRAGVEREMAFMGELGVGEPCNRPKTGKVWLTRWCYQRKGDAVRSRFVVRQFREGTDPSVHAEYTRTSGCEDSDTVSDQLALCRNGRFQCGAHAHTSDRRGVCGTCRRGKLAKGQSSAIAKSTQRIALRGGSLPSISAEPT